MPTTLATYLTQVRRLLHDPNAQFWSDSELTDYINEARRKTLVDTACQRKLQSVTLAAGTELYDMTSSGLVAQQTVLDVVGITVIWGSTRYPLRYMPFQELSATLRPYTSFRRQPLAFSRYGQIGVYIAPVPDQNYVTEWDTVWYSGDMSASTDAETMIYPYIAAVPYYAAYLGQIQAQAYEKADILQKLYLVRANEANNSYTARVKNVYPTG